MNGWTNSVTWNAVNWSVPEELCDGDMEIEHLLSDSEYDRDDRIYYIARRMEALFNDWLSEITTVEFRQSYANELLMSAVCDINWTELAASYYDNMVDE